jgi:hypothetical protein
MIERPDSGYEVVGLLPDAQRGAQPAWTGPTALTQRLVLEPALAGGPPALARAAQAPIEAGAAPAADALPRAEPLYELVRRLEVDLVVVALENRRNSLPTEELLRCRLGGIPVREQEAVYEQITGKIAVEALRPSYLIFNEGFSRQGWADPRSAASTSSSPRC